jgi:hypothetical protein
LLLILPLALGAQRTVRIDAGSGRMRFSDSIAATTFSFSPSFRVTTARASVSGSGTFARLEGASSNSGLLDATLRLLDRGALAMDANVFAGGSRHSDGARTGQMLGSIRFHAVATSRGTWLGAGVGRTWDGTWRNVAQLEATGWLVAGPSLLSAIVTPTIVDDTIRYADSFVAARYAVQRWELDGSIGIRAGGRVPILTTTRSSWGSLGATFWATPNVGINAAAGTYPVDFTQGFPGGQYVVLNARLRWSDTAMPNPRAARDLATPADQVAAFEVRRLNDGRHSVRVRAPNARLVEVSGDFSHWAALSLTPENGWWTTTLSLPGRTHEIAVRVDGGRWLVPPGLTPLRDEFGGVSGLLVIP